MSARKDTTIRVSGTDPTSPFDSPVAFHYSQTRRLAAWWWESRGNLSLPRKNALEPLAIPDLLPFVWITEHDPEADRFVYRLVGEEIRARYDTPLKNQGVRDIFAPEDAAHIRRVMHRVVQTPCAYHHMGAIYETHDRVGFGERLLLPLGDRDGRASHLLGISLYDVGTCAPAKQPNAGRRERDHGNRRFYPISAIESLAFPGGSYTPPCDPMAD